MASTTAATDWQSTSLTALTRHIISTHHAYLNRQLPLLSALLTAHTRAYWRQHPELLQAHRLFHQMKTGLDQHLIKEETAGFPLIQAHEAGAAVSLAPFSGNIPDHEAEHADARATLAQLRHTLWDHQLPADVGAEVQPTLDLLAALDADLETHIHLENDILFPRVRARAA